MRIIIQTAFLMTVAFAVSFAGRLPANDATSQSAPQRVVVAGGVIAEVIAALGLSDRIVGVDTSCIYPDDLLQEKEIIGYVRNLPAEGIVSLQPDVVITTEAAGPPPVIAQLRATDVRFEQLAVTYDVAAAAERIVAVGRIMGAESRAQEIAVNMQEKVATAQAAIIHSEDIRGMYLLHLRPGASLVGGADTGAAALLALAGCTNAADDVAGWKPLSAEAMAAAAPDFIIVDKYEAKEMGGVDKVAAMPGIALTPAGVHGRILVADHGKMLSFGPRLGQAVQEVVDFAAATGAGE